MIVGGSVIERRGFTNLHDSRHERNENAQNCDVGNEGVWICCIVSCALVPSIPHLRQPNWLWPNSNRSERVLTMPDRGSCASIACILLPDYVYELFDLRAGHA